MSEKTKRIVTGGIRHERIEGKPLYFLLLNDTEEEADTLYWGAAGPQHLVTERLFNCAMGHGFPHEAEVCFKDTDTVGRKHPAIIFYNYVRKVHG